MGAYQGIPTTWQETSAAKKQSHVKTERQMKRVQHKAIEKKVSSKICRVVTTLLCISTISHHAQHALFQSPFNLFINVYEFYHSILNLRKKMNEAHCKRHQSFWHSTAELPVIKKKKVITYNIENTQFTGRIWELLVSPAQRWIQSASNLPFRNKEPSPKPHFELKNKRVNRKRAFSHPRQQQATSRD